MKKKDFADSIVEEGLMEAAENFFGRRVKLEDEITLVQDMAAELEKFAMYVRECRDTLHYLMLRGQRELIARLYERLGVEPGGDDLEVDPSLVKLELLQIPSAFTAAGKFQKVFAAAYALYQNGVDQYYHGAFQPDTHNVRKKIRTVHYDQLQRMTRELNEKIRSINRDSKTSDVLQFSKKLDVERADKERITDTGIEYTLDKEMEFEEIDFGQFDLPSFPELPDPREVRGFIRQFAKEIYAQNPGLGKTILQEIRRARE